MMNEPQEYIFAADDGEDYRKACEISGEPLIQIEEFATADTQHLYNLEMPPLNKIVAVGRGSLSAYQVRPCIFCSDRLANEISNLSCGNLMAREDAYEKSILITGPIRVEELPRIVPSML